MTETTETAPQNKSPAIAGGRRMKNDLVVNRLNAIQRIQEIESLAGASRWATWLLIALLSCAVVWFLIQSIAMNLVVEHDIILTRAQIDHGARIEVPPAPSPFVDVINYFQAVMAGELAPMVLLHPLSIIMVLLVLLIIVTLMERGTTKRGGKSLVVDAPEAQQHQTRYFSNPLTRSSNDELPMTSEGAFGDDLPRNLRTLLSWWKDPSPPDRSALENGLQELRRYLGDTGYFWFCSCATLPRPHWHIAMYLGRALRTDRGKMVYSFENADKLGSLPWIIADEIPNWLRKALLAGLNKSQQQQLRRALQCLLISTSQRCKADMALELCSKHAPFMKRHGNDLTAQILENAPEGSELRDPLFKEFMLRGVDDAYYEENLEVPVRVISTENFQGRVSLASLWVSRAAWGVAALTLAGIILFLLFLKDYGGFKLSVSPIIGLIRVGDEKQNPPATFFWKKEGDHMITVTSKDYVTHHLMLDVQGRVMADLSPFPLTHFRSGRLRPLPDGSRGDPVIDEDDVREFPLEAREEVLQESSPGDREEEAPTPAPNDGAQLEGLPGDPPSPANVSLGNTIPGTPATGDAFAADAVNTPARPPQPLLTAEPRAGPDPAPPRDELAAVPPSPAPNSGAPESRSEFPAANAGHSERLSSETQGMPAGPLTEASPTPTLDFSELWEAFRTMAPPEPLTLDEPPPEPTAPPAQWVPSEHYRMLRRRRGVSLAVPSGSSPISTHGVEGGLVIEIEEQFLSQLQALRDYHLAQNTAQARPAPPPNPGSRELTTAAAAGSAKQ